MLLLLVVVLVLALIGGGIGLAVHALIWLFWLALAVFVIALIFGFAGRVFTSGRRTGARM